MTQDKIIDHLVWSKNLKNEESRICPICKEKIAEGAHSFVYLKEIYHSSCGYSNPAEAA